MMHEIKKEEYKKAEKCGLIPKLKCIRLETILLIRRIIVAIVANHIFVFIVNVQMHVGYLWPNPSRIE